ncbi:MAG: DUF4145 domain-containing protein [Limnothrix sp.]
MNIGTNYFLSTQEEPDPRWDLQNLDYKEGYVYELLFCLSCSNVTLRKHFEADYLEDVAKEETLYPSQSLNPFHFPQPVKEAYEAALKARNINANAYAMLLTTMLEKICLDKKVDGKDLHEKLKKLAENNEIPDKLADIAHSLRKLRNISVHEPDSELSEEEIPILDDLSRAVLEYIYIAPALARQAEIKYENMEERNKAREKKAREKKENKE